MRQTIIWRDDDVNRETNNPKADLIKFKEVHSLFVKYNVLHTVSLICSGIEKNKELVKYIRSQKNIDVQIHCFTHYDFTVNLNTVGEDLRKSIEVIEKTFGKKPNTLYPPWNRTSPDVEHIAWLNDLRVSNNKISIEQYLRGVKGDVVNWHFWAPEVDLLEDALKKYTESK